MITARSRLLNFKTTWPTHAGQVCIQLRNTKPTEFHFAAIVKKSKLRLSKVSHSNLGNLFAPEGAVHRMKYAIKTLLGSWSSGERLEKPWGRGVLPILGYTMRLPPIWVNFSTCRVGKGRELCCFRILAVAQIHIKLKEIII